MGGEYALHPARRQLVPRVLAAIENSLEFASVVSTNTVPSLPGRLVQIRPRTGLRGHLTQPMYLIRSSEVVLARRVRPASELRAMVGLGAGTAIGVLFFDNDEHLEQVWKRRRAIAAAFGAAGYDFVTSPSFSLYEPRSRLEHIYNLRRSDVMTGLLATVGVPVIPRVDWVIRHDIIRCARWVRQNVGVSTVALDWMTLKSKHSWEVATDGLQMLDDLTDNRLHYLINGPSSAGRWADLSAMLPTRLTLTKSTPLARPLPPGAEKSAADPYAWRAREAAELGLSEAA